MRLTSAQCCSLRSLCIGDGCQLNTAGLDQLHDGGEPDTKNSRVVPCCARTRIISASARRPKWRSSQLYTSSNSNLSSSSVDTDCYGISSRSGYFYLPQRLRFEAYHSSTAYVRGVDKQTRCQSLGFGTLGKYEAGSRLPLVGLAATAEVQSLLQPREPTERLCAWPCSGTDAKRSWSFVCPSAVKQFTNP